MTDLFGGEIQAPRHKPRKTGFAAPPGSGPAGETCGTCANLVRHRMAKTYLKCYLSREDWTGGPGTDIKSRAPACRYFASKT